MLGTERVEERVDHARFGRISARPCSCARVSTALSGWTPPAVPPSQVESYGRSELKQQAIEILHGNDRGGYTVPTATGLYPAQWNWDSWLVALGLAQFDEPRAVVEI